MASAQVEAMEAREERLHVETLVHVWLHRRLYGIFNMLGHRVNYRMADFNIRLVKSRPGRASGVYLIHP